MPSNLWISNYREGSPSFRADGAVTRLASGIDRIVLSHSHTRGSSPADRTRVSTLAVCGAARFPLWSASAMFTRRRKVRERIFD